MADSKITALTALTAADPANDMMPIVDVSDTSMAASGTTKRISINNILACSPSATLATATITGAANFNGGALAAYLNGNLMFGSSGNIVNFFAQSSGFAFKENTGANNLVTISNAGVFGFLDGAGGTRMTLNSTGLGVGASPTEKLTVWGAPTVYGDGRFNVGLFDPTSATTGTGSGISFAGYTNGVTVGATFAQIKGIKENSTAGNTAGALVFSTLANGSTPAERFRIDSSGNVGVGVTPSTLVGATRVEIKGSNSANLSLRSGSANASARDWMVASNVVAFGDFVVRQGASQGAEPNSGTDRMYFDPSGNIIITPTSTPPTLTVNGQIAINATSNTNLRFSYRGSDGVTRVANLTLA